MQDHLPRKLKKNFNRACTVVGIGIPTYVVHFRDAIQDNVFSNDNNLIPS